MNCGICGFTVEQHREPVPADWAIDPAAYPCDSYTDARQELEAALDRSLRVAKLAARKLANGEPRYRAVYEAVVRQGNLRAILKGAK